MNIQAHYNLLFHASLDAIVQVDRDFNITEANTSFYKLFKYNTQELIGKNIDDIFPARWHEEKIHMNSIKVLKGKIFYDEGIRKDKYGTPYDVIITGIPIMDAGIVNGAFILYRDITDQNVFSKAMAEQKLIYEALFKNSSDAIVRVDQNHMIIDINDNFQTLFGYAIDEIKGKELDQLITLKETLAMSEEITSTLLKGEKVILEGVRYSKTKEPVHVMIKGVPIVSAGKVIGGYGIYTDISERKKAEEKIIYISYHDELTGLYNRRFFEEELNRLDIARNQPLALIMADVNGLKLTNDAFGHTVGDGLLKKIGECLISCCRKDEIIARLGGDEFVILMANTDANQAKELVHRIKDHLEKTCFHNIPLSLSFGWDAKKWPLEPNEELFKRVEDLMYRHKLIESTQFKSLMFEKIIKTLHHRNQDEERHSAKVSDYAMALASAIGLSKRDVNELETAGRLHDIGKIAIDEGILSKKGPLDGQEWDQVKKHSEIGYRILSSVNEKTKIAHYILAHHEKFDGSGYPKGLKGNEIPIQSRILAIADAFDSMTRNQPYRLARSVDESLTELIKCSGTQFDPTLVDAFVQMIRSKKV